MSEIRVNNITNRDGTAGPSIGGIPVVDSNSHFVVPTGRTGQRYVDGGENIVRDGLVLHLDAKYSYPGATGTNPDVFTWYDLSGNENHGELKNGVSYSGTGGGSLVFDGVDDYITSSNPIVLGNNPRTLEVWCKGTSTDRVPLALSTSPSLTPNVVFAFSAVSSSLVNVYGGNNTYDENNIPVSINFIDGNWHQMLVTWDGNNPGTLLVYGDGSQVGSRVRGAGEAYNTKSGYMVGVWYDFNRYYNGNIAQVSIYNKALTASEVSQNFEALRSRFGI